jgi:predicted transcriptional regulator
VVAVAVVVVVVVDGVVVVEDDVVAAVDADVDGNRGIVMNAPVRGRGCTQNDKVNKSEFKKISHNVTGVYLARHCL